MQEFTSGKLADFVGCESTVSCMYAEQELNMTMTRRNKIEGDEENCTTK
jgi:hypothetical protein